MSVTSLYSQQQCTNISFYLFLLALVISVFFIIAVLTGLNFKDVYSGHLSIFKLDNLLPPPLSLMNPLPILNSNPLSEYGLQYHLQFF